VDGVARAAHPLTVRQIFTVPELGLRLVAGAAGLDRLVRRAHATELVDPGPYLRGQEIVLTAGVSLTGGAGPCEVFARAVDRALGSAIAYSAGDVRAVAPGELGTACDRLGLPLLEVPGRVRFTAWLTDHLAAVTAEEHRWHETGRLLDLVRSGLAATGSLHPELEARGMSSRLLLGAALPAATLGAHSAGGVLAGLVGDVALIVAASEKPVLALADGGPCGIGTPGPLDDLAASLSDALDALSLARRSGGTVRAADLATFPALLARLGRRQVAPFVDRIARPLASYDAEHGTWLTGTLRAFLESGGSVQVTARELREDGGTIRDRLALVAGITGRDPFAFEDRVALAVALRVWEPALPPVEERRCRPDSDLPWH
jgi:hypothetical protein